MMTDPEWVKDSGEGGAGREASECLRLEGVSLGFSAQGPPVLEGLNLQLARGEIGCLLGASGCGKTTALRVIAGFERIRQGRIVLNGAEVAAASRHVPPQQRGVGMVFQDYALFPHLDVAGNIGFGLSDSSREARKARIAELLELVELTAFAHVYPHRLSGGQQQRVAIARALAPKPGLLLLDEPFSSLDASLRESLAQAVRKILKSAGATALLVTHDQQEAFAVGDRVGVMQGGRLLQWDDAWSLYHQPVNRYVADFVGEGVLLPGTVVAPGEVSFELGRCPCANPVCGAAGERIQVLLRPDDILHDDSSPLQARVQHKVFRGAEFLYTLSLPSGATVLSLVPSHHDHALGEMIGIRLEIDHLIAFPGESSASV